MLNNALVLVRRLGLRVYTLVILLSVICSVSIGDSANAAKELVVFSKNTPRIYLDFPKTEEFTSGLKMPTDDFCDYFARITGRELATKSGNPGNLIPVRMKLMARPSGVAINDAAYQQGFQIYVSKKEIVLNGYTFLGLQNALYYILDRWGCRWVMPGKIGEVIPKRSILTLPIGTIISPERCDSGPDSTWTNNKDSIKWYARNMGGSNHYQSSQHYWLYAIPPDKYLKDHPEWYALIGGERKPTQLCTTNPEVIAKMIEVARVNLRNNPSAASFPFDPEDNNDFCQCDRCRAQDPPGVGEDGNPLLTDRVIYFANAVADGIKDEFPDRFVAPLAYLNHLMPPVNAKPAKNVLITICRSNNCMLHMTPTSECPSSIAFYDIVRGWSKVTSNVYVYEYVPIPWTGSLPSPIYLDFAKSIGLLFNKYGVKGGVVDRVPTLQEQSASCYINYYLERRLKADPSRNPEKELSDMCKGFFGPAGKPMEMYYRELAKATKRTHPGRSMVGMGLYKYDELFSKEMIASARKQMNLAIAATDGRSPYSERVKLVDASQQFLEAYLNGVWRAQQKDYDGCIASFDRADAVIEEMRAANALSAEDPNWSAVQDAHWRQSGARLKTLAEYFPDRMGLIRSWKLLGPFENARMDADLRVDSFEPISSIGKPVKLADGSTAQWIDYKSPEGLLNLDKAFEDNPGSKQLSYSYCGVQVNAPSDMQVQFKMDSFYPFKVYLNGLEVFHKAGINADRPDAYIESAKLLSGDNTIVFKLSQKGLTSYSFPWGLYFRITDQNGNPIRYSETAVGKLVIN